MPAEIVTTDDLREFKLELFRELRRMFLEHHGQPAKRWLKSGEIRKLLGISPGTLQNLRVKGQLPFTKLGGVLFYDFEDVRKMLESPQPQNPFSLDKRR